MRIEFSLQPVLLSTIALTAIAAGPFDLSWHTIDGGGVMHSSGGRFELSGSIGQADAGRMTGGNFKLTSGFWFETPPGDGNGDGVVGLSDHAAFVDCLTGLGVEFLPADECRSFDFDGSGTVDLSDFAELQRGFHGE